MFKKIETLQEALVRNIEDALREDIGTGSLTELFVETSKIEAIIISRQNAVLCGVDWCVGCFKRVNPHIEINFYKFDGELLKENEVVCSITSNRTNNLILFKKFSIKLIKIYFNMRIYSFKTANTPVHATQDCILS